MNFKTILKILSISLFLPLQVLPQNLETGNVVFIHPDGTGLSMWNAMRILYYGPDTSSNWDRLPHIGLYQGHTKNTITTSSHAGATMHAYGVKVVYDSYGMDGQDTIISRSGKKLSIMEEAKQKGIKTGLINSGSVVEPGTGAFVASVLSRGYDEEITKQIVTSGTDLIFSGGEEWFLPVGVEGKFTKSGKRKDNLNLIKAAEDLGYYIVYTKYDLWHVPDSVTKILGIFSFEDTFFDKTEEDLEDDNLPLYLESAPTLGEMTEFALEFFEKQDQQFLLVVEEEGTDNFGNKNNARGTFEALKRADDAIGITLKFMEEHPNTLLITASDSEASGMEITGFDRWRMKPDEELPDEERNGAPIDGIMGEETKPFMSAPDLRKNRFPFRVNWSTTDDVFGGVVARAAGLNADLVKGKFDNTDVYRVMYATLFGKWLD